MATVVRVSSRVAFSFDPIRRAARLWERTWGTEAASQAMASATSIMRVQQLLLTRYDRMLAALGLTFSRYEALVLLSFSREGRLSMSKLGERLMVHPTSVTHTVQRLEAQGFVHRMPNPEDGRGTLAAITAQGRAVVEQATVLLVGDGFGLDCLEDEEQAELYRLLEKIRRSAGDFNGQ